MIRELFNWLFPCRHNETACKGNWLGCKCGKGETSITYPSAPAAPSTAEAMDAWVKALPQVYEAQLKYGPQEAEQQIALAQKYALPIAQTMQGVDQTLYPKTAGLQESMAGQATQGMNATAMPDWMRKNYMSDMNAQMGNNAGSPIGADYMSRGMQEQLFNQQKYYRDLGLSLAGRQPLTVASQPQTTNYASTMTPQSTMNFMQQGYGTYAQATRPIAMQDTRKYGLGWLLSM